MPERNSRAFRTVRFALAAVAGAVLVLPLAAGGAAHADPTPQQSAAQPDQQALHIRFGSGQAEAREGEKLSTDLEVTNTSSADLTKLLIRQSFSNGLGSVVGDHDAEIEPGQAVWHLDLPAGQSVTLHTEGVVGANHTDDGHMYGSACAYAQDSAVPFSCATHIIPWKAEAGSASGQDFVLWTAAAGFAAAAAGAAVLVLRRRRSEAAGSPTEAGDAPAAGAEEADSPADAEEVGSPAPAKV